MGAWPVRIPTSPSYAGATTWVASPSKSVRSGEITETLSMRALRARDPLGVGQHVLDATGHEERGLGKLVELSVHDPLERRDGVLELDVLALDASELLSHR